MKSAMLAIFAVGVVGFFMFLGWGTQDNRAKEAEAKAVAANFLVFRQAAFALAVERKTSGVITQSELSAALPPGYAGIHHWNARVEASFLYVWGPASDLAVELVRDAVRGSASVGRAVNGSISPKRYNPVPLPNFIGAGSLVSVLGVGF